MVRAEGMSDVCNNGIRTDFILKIKIEWKVKQHLNLKHAFHYSSFHSYLVF